VRIAGIERCSFVDWPGLMSAVLFTPGCNLNCFFCHNRHILGTCDSQGTIPIESFLDWLRSRSGFLDGVVMSGGEPTLQEGLAGFIRDVRALGFPVKLDTNGTRPHALGDLLEQGLLDYVAMDIKAPRDKYDDVCGTAVDEQAVDASIKLIMRSGIEYEFRTTVLPQLTEDDVAAMAHRICGARYYILQQFRRPAWFTEDAEDIRLAREPHPYAALEKMTETAKEFVQCCETRGILAEEPAIANLA